MAIKTRLKPLLRGFFRSTPLSPRFRGSSIPLEPLRTPHSPVRNWDLNRCIAQQTGLEPNQQRLLFRGNEKEDREHLHMAGVKDNAKVLLIQDPTRKRGSMKRLRALKCQVPVQPLLKSNQRLISLQKSFKAHLLFFEQFHGLLVAASLPETHHHLLGLRYCQGRLRSLMN